MSSLPKDVKVAMVVFAVAILVLSLGAYFFIFNFLNSPPTTFMPAPAVSVARNWAGYLAATDLQNPQSSVTGVSGSWVVPSVSDIGTDAFSAVWVGIGGQFDNTLIQTGTEQDFVNGSPVYSVWYEMLPQDAVTIDVMTVFPGDQMQASINLIDNNSNLWTISIADLTNGQSFQQNFTYNSQQLSADWIVERPQVNNVLATLANFGSVTFSNCRASIAGTAGSIADFQNTAIVMDAQNGQNQSVQIVNVSALFNQGTQFTVDYTG